MIPAIFRLTCRLAREYSIPCVRLTRELPYAAGGLRKRVQPFVNSNVLKHLLLNAYARVNEAAAQVYGVATPDYFVGVNYTAHMSLTAVVAGLRAAPYGSVEVLLHPAIGPDPRDVEYPTANLRRYVRARQRGTELRSLRSAKLADFLRQGSWMTTNFSTFAQQASESRPAELTPEIDPRVASLGQTIELRCPPWVSEAQPDSRAFAQLVVSQTQAGGSVLDVGTGTGIIAICAARSGRKVVAADISAAALRTARANASRNGVELECRQSDLLASIEGRFDLIAFNPPYNFRPDNLAMNVAKHMARRVDWVRRNSGLAMPRPVLKFHQELIARLIAQGPAHLNDGGAVLLHAYEAEVAALSSVLPAGASVTILRHPDLRNRTVGMLIRLSPAVA
jgi:methylase of polypeptide subunit release factors